MRGSGDGCPCGERVQIFLLVEKLKEALSHATAITDQSIAIDVEMALANAREMERTNCNCDSNRKL